MKHTRRRFIKIGGVTTLASLSGVAFGFSGCNDAIDENNALRITGVSIPSTLDIMEAQDITLSGKGFLPGDQMQLAAGDGALYTSAITRFADGKISFAVPGGIRTGAYTLTVIRTPLTLLLGNIYLNVIATADLPDIKGMTLKGQVYCDGQGVANVVVSDGYEVTTTDSKGRYYLSSQKKSGFVFISVPGNYEVANNVNAPQFFKRLNSTSDAVERNDFSLVKVNNDKHVVISMADWHLANRNNDLAQFTSKVLPDVNATIDKYAADGNKVYVLTLGDLSWELYWYDNKFGLNEYIPYMNKLKAPVFNLMGNHDNDPYYSDDWNAEKKYKEIIGPTYYSFNLGKVHYVVLDDVEYLNKGGAEGIIGDRSYNDKVAADQIAWLKKDLAAITDKNTPIVLATHTPLYQNPKLDTHGDAVNAYDLSNGGTLVDCFREFATVHVLTGHTHINYTVEKESFLMEHNTAAICATWWWTGKNGYAGNHICRDGSPGGYGVWKNSGRNMQWLYKSIGYAEDYQFRAYDLNTTHITAAAFAPNSTDTAMAPYAGPYAQPQTTNDVLINVWGYDTQWKIEVTENGQKLDVKRVEALDPLHIISYEALRLNAAATPTAAFVTTESAHMFKVRASSATATLEIKVTDRFGKVSTESMARPKAFSVAMK